MVGICSQISKILFNGVQSNASLRIHADEEEIIVPYWLLGPFANLIWKCSIRSYQLNIWYNGHCSFVRNVPLTNKTTKHCWIFFFASWPFGQHQSVVSVLINLCYPWYWNLGTNPLPSYSQYQHNFKYFPINKTTRHCWINLLLLGLL